MRDLLKIPRILSVFAVLATAGACGSLPEVGSVSLVPSVSSLSRPDWLTYSGNKNEFALRPVTAADLVTENGQCAPAEGAAAPDPSAEGGQQPFQSGGIALQMTECDVVRRAGAPEQLQLGADERGDRSAVMTYTQGPRPGIYRFSAGRLTSIERAPDAPGARAAPKAKSSKKPARS
jgi:hypothetical protein